MTLSDASFMDELVPFFAGATTTFVVSYTQKQFDDLAAHHSQLTTTRGHRTQI